MLSLNLKSYPSWFLFMITLLLGLLMVLSSDNWFMCWVGLELSLLGFVPLIVSGTLSLEGVLKYFLVQAGGSSLLVLSFMLLGELSGFIYLVSLLLKLGLAPFYQWVPSVVSSLSLFNVMILLTFQKVGPLVMMFKGYMSYFNLLALFCLLSVVVGGLGGVNQTHMQMMIAYSSIAHSGWTVICVVWSISLCVFYFLFYCFSLILLLLVVSFSNLYKVYKLNMNFNNRLMVGLLLLNLSGLPPFPLFFAKLLVVLSLISYYPIYLTMMVLSSSMTIYFYMYNVIPSSNLSFKRVWNMG